MLALARAHPLVLSWLVVALLGGLLAMAGPALFVLTADLFLPGAAASVAGVAGALNVLLLLFHGSLVVAGLLTLRAAIRRLLRR